MYITVSVCGVHVLLPGCVCRIGCVRMHTHTNVGVWCADRERVCVWCAVRVLECACVGVVLCAHVHVECAYCNESALTFFVRL